MKRFAWTLVLTALPLLAGCNGGGSASKDKANDAPQSAAKGSPLTPAAEVVAQFLDSFRRGDETTAGKLLTQEAIAEIKKCGLELAPPGSPDSSFEMGKTEYLDADKDTAYVEIAWTEPVEGSQEKKRYEALFCVRLEEKTAAWRIAGMVIESNPGAEPEVIDFENLSQNLAQDLAPPQGTQQPGTQQPGTQQQGFQQPGSPVAQNPNGANPGVPNQLPASQFNQPQLNQQAQQGQVPGQFQAPQQGQFSPPQNFQPQNFQQPNGQPSLQLAQPPAGSPQTIR